MAVNQVFQSNSYSYCVIDNVAAQTFPVLSDNTHIGYDTMQVPPRLGAAAGQGSNTYTNGTIPGFVKTATSISTGLVLVNLKYANPA